MSNSEGNEYVEVREGGYYVAGTRIGLDVIVDTFRLGTSPESILQAYPSIGSLAKVYGVITFILENLEEIESYLKSQDALWDELRERHPLPADALERFKRAKKEAAPESA